jgi:dTDP-4-dehydrorhamnose 3,5-epimerase
LKSLKSEENKYQLFVPKGFAHGFCVLSEEVDFLYKCSDFYTPGDEYGIRWDDPEIAIDWPEIVEPIVSDKDENAPLLKEVSAEHLPTYVK